MSLGALTQYITIPIKLFPEVLDILTEKLRGIFASNLSYRLVFQWYLCIVVTARATFVLASSLPWSKTTTITIIIIEGHKACYSEECT